MSNHEQNGRSTAEQMSPPTDPRLRGVKPPPQTTADSQKLCRDYVWGICTSKDCRYKHELEFESMRQILKFCHDFQNRTGCTRPDCTYLHCSRDEENQFLNSGVIPRVLLERYTVMAEADRPEANQNMQMYQEYVARPPPPPPAAQQPVASTQPRPNPVAPVAATPIIKVSSVSTLMPHVPGPLPTILQPPPPPPPLPPTVAQQATPVSQPIYTVTPPMQHMVTPMYPMAPAPQLLQPQQMSPLCTLPAIFNPSVPPPPLPVAIQPVAQKRPAVLETEAGPSKLAKVDEYPEPICDSCLEVSFRSQICAQELEKIKREEEVRRAEYDSNMEEYEKGRILLRSKLAPHLFQSADEFIDGLSPDMFASTSSPTYSPPQLSKQLVFQLMEFLVNKLQADTETASMDALSRRAFSQAELTRISRLQDSQGLAALLDQIAASSNERRELSMDPVSRLGAELPSPPLARYSAPGAYPSFVRDTPDPLFAFQQPATQPAPRPALYNYPPTASTSSMQYGAQPPANGAAPAPYQQYLSRMPPNHNPYYRPFQ